MMNHAQRIDFTPTGCGLQNDFLHLAGALQFGFHRLRKREMIDGLLGRESQVEDFLHPTLQLRVEVAAVILGYTYLLEHRSREHRAVGLHVVVVLHPFVVGQRFAVDIHLVGNDLERVTGLAHTTLHVVLAPVHRSRDDVAEHVLAVLERGLAVVVT